MEFKMRTLSLFAGMLVVSGLIYANPPLAQADTVLTAAGPVHGSPVVDYPLRQAAEPTSLSTSTVLGVCMLIAWRFRRGRAD
jgi:hypothetical protein